MEVTMKTDAQIKKDVFNALKWSSEIREEHIVATTAERTQAHGGPAPGQPADWRSLPRLE